MATDLIIRKHLISFSHDKNAKHKCLNYMKKKKKSAPFYALYMQNTTP